MDSSNMQPTGLNQPMGIPQPMNSAQPGYQTGPNGMPMVQQVQVPTNPKKDITGLIKTIAIIVVSLIAVTFIGLFIWMTVQYENARSDVQGEIDVAVADAKDKQASEMEAEFLNREKYPYKTFTGPVDYGQLTFEYPKTWSVYIEAAADAGGDFKAYFNPVQVEAVGDETINALRVTIRNEGFDEVAAEYQKAMDKKDSGLTMEATTIGKNTNITANRYTGKLPNTDLSGYIVIFKIRDKTVIMQTDSVLFTDEYNKLLGTITFNE